MKNSLEYLKIKIKHKNLITITGNVNDLYCFNDDEHGFLNVDLKNIIESFAKENNYKIAHYFAPSFGAIDLLEEETNGLYKQLIALDDINSFMNHIVEKTKDFVDEYGTFVEHEKGIYVINFADSFFDNQNNSNNYIDNLVNVISMTLDNNNKSKYIEDYSRLTDKIIFIMRDSNNLIKDLYMNNIEYIDVQIKKPNMQERKDIIRKNAHFFRTIDKMDLNSETEILQKAVAMSEGLSCIEILQLGRVNESQQSFSNRYNLIYFNQRESEWEKIDYEKIRKIKEQFSKRVQGQDYAIDKISQVLINSFLGLNGLMFNESLNKPKGILFFVGPTGTGKTEISKTLAEFVFGSERKLIRFDMSEYNHEHSDQRLIGAPPGYVGYDSGGELTNKVKLNPFSILLFDEIEKAHPKILDKFLQILEDGRLTSSKGELIDFSETFIIFTSNIGTAEINDIDITDDKAVRSAFIKEVKKHFIEKINRPELLNRIGNNNIVPFNFIHNREIIKNIIKSKMKVLFDKIYKDYNLLVNYNDVFEKLVDLIKKITNHHMGARGVINSVDEFITKSIGDFIFANYPEIQTKKQAKLILNVDMIIEDNKAVFIFKQ
ncbi:AAA family ATPase [Ureaplasma zalophigenitalium]|uniref:AAA family ATPase n=1 Tax=Ureaplasma zalophigenitalium TaxID=907723 RepID=A0ABT3BP90_9BACT|nr:AAA family ATPase [Ureaplasma zalophigenitalium]MCV3754065.1 AAA family ATPase [Ureaplasma zalophigenitalium]